MRFIFAVGILLNSSLLPATTINSGTFSATTILGNSFWTSSGTFSGPDISVAWTHAIGMPLCLGAPGSTCNVDFTRTFNLVANNTVSQTTPTAVVTYGGNTYIVNLASGPNTSFALNLNFSGPAVGVVLTSPCPQNCSIFGEANNIPFTMTGNATLTVNGIVVFSNLALSGSGSAAFSSANNPTPLDGQAIMTYAFAAAPTGVPEPASYATAAAGLLGLALLRQRKR